MKKILLIIAVMICSVQFILGQDKVKGDAIPDPTIDEYKPLTVKLNEDGSKFLRFVIWRQFWLTEQKKCKEQIQNDPQAAQGQDPGPGTGISPISHPDAFRPEQPG